MADRREKQKAFEYAFIAIVGSYFEKMTYSSDQMKKNLKLNFCEVGLGEQAMMEEQCIKIVETELFKRLPRKVWKDRVKVQVIKRKDFANSVLVFRGERYALVFRTKYIDEEHAPQYTMHVWMKEKQNLLKNPSVEITR